MKNEFQDPTLAKLAKKIQGKKILDNAQINALDAFKQDLRATEKLLAALDIDYLSVRQYGDMPEHMFFWHPTQQRLCYSGPKGPLVDSGSKEPADVQEDPDSGFVADMPAKARMFLIREQFLKAELESHLEDDDT